MITNMPSVMCHQWYWEAERAPSVKHLSEVWFIFSHILLLVSVWAVKIRCVLTINSLTARSSLLEQREKKTSWWSSQKALKDTTNSVSYLFFPYWNIWTVMMLGSDITAYPPDKNSEDPLTYNFMPPSGQNLNLYDTSNTNDMPFSLSCTF